MKTIEAKKSSGPKSGRPPTPDLSRGPKAFFKGVQREARLVSWPTPKEVTRLTGTVIGICALVAGFLYVLSIVIETFFRMLGIR